MTRYVSRLVSVFVLSALASNSYGQQPERIVSCGPEPVAISYGASTTGCDISPSSDIDSFSFYGVAGDDVRILMRGNGFFDGSLELRDPTSALVTQNSCSASGSGCTVTLISTLTLSGTYTILASDSGSNDTSSYVLQLELVPSVAAEVIRPNSSDSDSSSPATDIDQYAFEGVSGDVVRIVASGNGFFDTKIEVVAPSGVIFHNQSCFGGGSGCSLTTPNLTLTSTGTYHILVSDSGSEDTSSYSITLQCISGSCPVLSTYAYCFGDGTGHPCPCTPGGPGQGCAHSSGSGSVLTTTGTPSISNDTLILQASSLPSPTVCLFTQGTGASNAGYGLVQADGLICIAGTIIRLGTKPGSGGGAAFGSGIGSDPLISVRGMVTSPGTRFYQARYRNNVAFCTPDTSNWTTAVRVVWAP